MADPQKIVGDDSALDTSAALSQSTLVASPESSTLENTTPLTQRVHPPEFPSKHAHILIDKTNLELKQAVHDIQSSEDRLDHYVARLQDDRVVLLRQIKNLEAQLLVARNSNLPEETTRRMEVLLTEAQDKIKMLSGVVPENILSRDRAVMQKIVKKWHEYDQARTRQAVAENKFNKNPEDKRSEGDINRARTEAYALNQEISSLITQGGSEVAASTSNPTLDEGIAYTHEQSITDTELRAQKKSSATIPQPTPPAPEKLAVESVQEHEEESVAGVAPIAPEVDLDPVIWEDTHPSLEEQTVPELVEVEKNILPTPPIAPLEEKVDLAPVQESEAPPVLASEEIPAPVITEQPIEPPTEKADTQQQSVFTPEPVDETTSTMPQDIMPSDPQALAYADMQIHNHLDILFGSKGFWGVGVKKGVDSPHWKDALYGFADKPVAEILATEPETFTIQNETVVGIKNRAAVEKMQNYIMIALSETGVHPGTDEKAEDYLKRAAAITIGRFMEKEKVKPQL